MILFVSFNVDQLLSSFISLNISLMFNGAGILKHLCLVTSLFLFDGLTEMLSVQYLVYNLIVWSRAEFYCFYQYMCDVTIIATSPVYNFGGFRSWFSVFL